MGASKKHSSSHDKSDNIVAMIWHSLFGANPDKHQLRLRTSVMLAITILLVASVALTAFNYRTGGLDLEITDVWARQTFDQNAKNQLAQSVRQDFPNIDDQRFNGIVDERYNELRKDPEFSLRAEQSIANLSAAFKQELKDEQGHTYLVALDPYYYMRLTKNIIENGHPGEFLVNDTPASNWQLAPSISYPKVRFHSWFQAVFFQITQPITGFTIEDLPATVFFTPVIFMVLASICAFFIGKITSGNIAGWIAGMFVALHPMILQRTIGGFSDTDAYNIFFPLLITLLIILSIQSKNKWITLAYSAIAALVYRLYMWSWGGAIFIFYIVAAMLAAYVAARVVEYLIRHKSISAKRMYSALEHTLFVAVPFTVIALFFFALEEGIIRIIERIFTSGQTFTGLKDTTLNLLWPNVYTTVAELSPASFNEIVTAVGGNIVFFISLVGFVTYSGFTFFKNWKDENSTKELHLFWLALAWYGSTIYASFTGVRFVILLAPIVCIGIGLFAGSIISIIQKSTEKTQDFNSRLVTTIAAVLLMGIVLLPVIPITATTSESIVSRAESINLNAVPSMTDGFYTSLTNIRDNSNESAIISSWWDFGHQFTSIGERGASADGGSQNTPQAHWLGRMLVEADEEESVGILRMLNCNANGAFTTLFSYVHEDGLDERRSQLKTMEIIDSLLGTSRAQATSLLQNEDFEQWQIDTILKSTHCQAPESFVIASQDMIAKAGVWAHFGLWDFEKAFIANEVEAGRQSQALSAINEFENITGPEASQLYNRLRGMSNIGQQYISPFQQYYGSQTFGCTNDFNRTLCRVGFVLAQNDQGQFVLEGVEITDNNVSLSIGLYDASGRSGSLVDPPAGFVFIGQNATDYEYTEYVSQQNLHVVYDERSNSILITDPAMSRSLFTRMFFFDGRGTKYLDQFDKRTTFRGEQISVFKVNWDRYYSDFAN